ncbi:hypothetical protein B0T11DRAFT_231088 [Plectosphaerella cucumerina]|uniref:Uncharacterized protein n=1 Tax=Plectosphaerella cucumerina TaxID=40658 RepID=A0A8K0T8U3_9PEZI|nr:hypothetical protein B0T11DRAFT_231088 [Plectosphaerella cucumerina]
MSSPGLTPNQPSPAQPDHRYPDSETERDRDRERERPQLHHTKSSELFSGVYRGIKKFAPAREDPQIRRSPSLLGFRTATPPSIASSPSPPFDGRRPPPLTHNARNLSLQSSLEKPLPEPPPDSPGSPGPAPPSENASSSLGAILEDVHIGLDTRSFAMEAPAQAQAERGQVYSQSGYNTDMSSSQTSLASSSRQDGEERQENLTPKSTGPASAGPSPSSKQRSSNAGSTTPAPGGSSSGHLSGLMCNVHRTTGREPHPLVGATTTILGDKLYVFGGRILSRSRPAPLTADLYELDLIRRHWTKLETTGDIPPPRYFHSMCALGDTKMVCYGGMSPTPGQTIMGQDQQPEVTVMSDIYVYDISTRKWTYIPAQDPPQGRYAHCACILPSSASFSSFKAPLSALQHNPSSGNPNEGRIGINIDGTGGSEMIIVGGQDGANHYIEQISVFNLRSLKWVSTQPLGKSCGAYRSVVAPLPPSVTSRIGKAGNVNGPGREGGISQEAREPGSSMLIYSNYNFLDVKLELQVRSSDGVLSEKPMSGAYSPPGLRFPNGGVIDTHFIVSGTYLTSSKQEYALWALDLRSLTWSRIDAGGSVFSQGSWNRGVLWNRRNTFVILGNRKRSLVDDYNHRRINFTNVCMVELEAFGFYDNPRKTTAMSGFVSASSPFTVPGLSLARKAGCTAGGRAHSRASEELGEKALALRELADMDILCLHGERVPVNSRIVARRWGPYFVQLLREGAATQDGSDSMTLRSGLSNAGTLRNSAVTITPSSRNTIDSSSLSSSSTLAPSSNYSGKQPSQGSTGPMVQGVPEPGAVNMAPTPRTLAPNSRPRCLYLPHTYLTVQALLHFLYTSALPGPTSPLCTPPILCSLLQIARPYRIDGLLEAVVERLHVLLDSRNAAAVFNATAMAAGGGRGIDGSLNPNFFVSYLDPLGSAAGAPGDGEAPREGEDPRTPPLRLNTAGVSQGSRPASEELSATTSASGSEWSSEIGGSDRGQREIWAGELSSVIGLQKRGLRGLMEGRRMRERTGTNTGGGMGGGSISGPSGPPGSAGGPYGGGGAGQPRVGLGIAGS